MHTLFTLEDRYGLKIEKADDGQPRLYLDLKHFPDSSQIYDMMLDWMGKAVALESKHITQNKYDHWRYHYPTVGQTTYSFRKSYFSGTQRHAYRRRQKNQQI